MPIYCPSDTQDLINRNEISNFALRYQRFLENEVGNGGRVKFSIDATNLGDSQGAIGPLRDRQTNQLDYLAKITIFSAVFTKWIGGWLLDLAVDMSRKPT